MNKTAEKILMSPINALVWATWNTAEVCLISVIILSLAPFVYPNWHHDNFYTAMGGILGFVSYIMAGLIYQKDEKLKNKKAVLYAILCGIVLIFFLMALYFLDGKKTGDHYNSFELFLTTYFGAFLGLMGSGIIVSFIERERAEKKKQRELDKIWMEKQNEQRIISQKEKEGLVAIKMDGKLIGYIEKEKYDEFVKRNIMDKNKLNNN